MNGREIIIGILNVFFKIPGSDTFFWRIIGKRFIAGETIEEGLLKTNELKKQGFRVTLAYAGGEHTETEAELGNVMAKHEEMIERAAASGYEYELALKPSAFMLPTNEVYPKFFGGKKMPSDKIKLFVWAVSEINKIIKKAAEKNMLVWIDAENFDYRGPTADLVVDLAGIYENENLGLVVQSCFKDCASFYRELVREISIRTASKRRLQGVRICKGGCYREKQPLIYRKKREIVNEFFRTFEKVLGLPLYSEPKKIQIATHDEKNILNPLEKRLNPQIELGVLYGRHESPFVKNLMEKGWPVNVYALIGPRKNCRKYLIRRVVENPKYLFFPFVK